MLMSKRAQGIPNGGQPKVVRCSLGVAVVEIILDLWILYEERAVAAPHEAPPGKCALPPLC